MVQFLDNTIYTNYALNKICENLAEEISNFNFIKVKVGSGDNSLSQDRTDLSTLLYSLVVQELSYDKEQGILTIRCELPPELADIPVTEIALFDTVMGFDHMFSYSKVNIVKPSDIGYELTIVLNLGPRTIDFPGINEYYIPQYEYATAEALNNFTDNFIYITTNLERVIRSNAGEVGRNMAEVAYKRQKALANHLREIGYASTYYSMSTKFKNEITDMFFIHEPDYLSYDLINFADERSKLTTFNKLWKANRDNISFHNGPCTLIVMAKLNDITKESTIINKKADVDLYFSMDIKQNIEPYLLYLGPGAQPTYQTAKYDELVITFYGLSDVYEMRYILDKNNIGNYINRTMPYVITFNGDFNNPDIHFYFDGVEPEIITNPTEIEPSLTEQAGITADDTEDEKQAKLDKAEEDLKARLYGKMIIPNSTDVLYKMPNNSYIPVKNYLTNFNTGEIDRYENATGITEIMSLKRQVNKHELAFLTNTFTTLGEIED